MFGIGGSELLVILVVALLVLGPKKLPDLARTLGKALGEFRRVSTEFQRTLNTEVALDETRQKEEAARQSAQAASQQTAGTIEQPGEQAARPAETPAAAPLSGDSGGMATQRTDERA